MIKAIKEWINTLKIKSKIRKVEKVLGLKLYEWQKLFILGKLKFTQGMRASGKTLAWDLRLLLNPEYYPPQVVAVSKASFLDDEPTIKDTQIYRKWHAQELIDLYNKLKGHIKLPTITMRR